MAAKKVSKKHWTLGNNRMKVGGKLMWRTACGKWLRLHQCAPWGKLVTCKKCRAHMNKVATSQPRVTQTQR